MSRYHRNAADSCDDRPSDAAANCLTEESTNIHAAGCTAQHRHKCGEDLTSNAASNCTRDGVARRAEAHVLRRRARCIATECTGYNLNYEIDECSRHMSLPCPQNGRLGYFILSALEGAVARVFLTAFAVRAEITYLTWCKLGDCVAVGANAP